MGIRAGQALSRFEITYLENYIAAMNVAVFGGNPTPIADGINQSKADGS